MGFDETASRRAEFAGGTALLLPDGQAWTFCEPAARAVSVGGKEAVAFVFGDGLDAETTVALGDAAYRVLGKYSRATSAEQRASCVFEWAMLAFLRNYDLDPAAFSRIMTAGPIAEGLLLRLERMLLDAVRAGMRTPGGAA